MATVRVVDEKSVYVPQRSFFLLSFGHRDTDPRYANTGSGVNPYRMNYNSGDMLSSLVNLGQRNHLVGKINGVR